MSLPLALRERESIAARELLCLQQCCTLLDRCKSSANGYEQCRTQIRVHEDRFLSSVPQIFFPHCYQKRAPSRRYRMQAQRYRLQA